PVRRVQAVGPRKGDGRGRVRGVPGDQVFGGTSVGGAGVMSDDAAPDVSAETSRPPVDVSAETSPSSPGAPSGPRKLGAAKMGEVYGFSVDPDDVTGGYLEVTVDHLFGAIWTRPGLDVASRRLATIGAIAAQGQH